MSPEREFRTAAVLSAVYGWLLCDIGEVYDVLSFLTGRSVFTHELPSAGKQAAPHVFAQLPAIAGLELSHVTRENWREELAILEARFGPTLTLAPIGWNALADKSPLETLTEMVGEDRVIVVEVPPDV